ncbi:MAG: hypothetical protein WC851_00700 [Candidatus Shapirobacteria bacterium]|jgi:hypothetical protein
MNNSVLIKNIDSYLDHKVPSTEISDFINNNPEIVNQYMIEFDRCVNSFNKFRVLTKFPNKYFYKNSHQLNQTLEHDLPKFKTIFTKLESDQDLSSRIFLILGSDTYLVRIWQVRPIKLLLPNILLLIYRTTILFLNKEILIDSKGRRKVQISSSIEEMVFYNYLLGDKLDIYDAFSIWLDDWRDEGFSEKLYLAVINNKNVIQ